MLYTTQSDQTFKMFKQNPGDFQVYHDGFQNQVSKWPVNPIDHIIEEIKKRYNYKTLHITFSNVLFDTFSLEARKSGL